MGVPQGRGHIRFQSPWKDRQEKPPTEIVMVVKIRSSPIDRRKDPSSFTTFCHYLFTLSCVFIIIINKTYSVLFIINFVERMDKDYNYKLNIYLIFVLFL
jgi:hypothetical protein